MGNTFFDMQLSSTIKLKQFTSTLILLMVVSLSYSQLYPPPGGINYQAIARDTNGLPLSNATNLHVKFTIWDSIISGNILFSETHNQVSTNKYGLFNLVIGKADSASFDSLQWFVGKKFLEVAIDSGNTGYFTMPRVQMMSVPFALHAKTSLFSFANWSLLGNQADNTHFLGTTNSQGLIIKTNNAERMRIASNGNIGIGTASPTAPLTIQTLSTAGNELEFLSSGFNADIYANSQFNIGSLTSVNLLTNGSNRLHINNSGYVGIGTVSPGAMLEVAGQVKITGGSPGLGKVLTSDAAGLASWNTPAFPFTPGDGLTLNGAVLNSTWTTLGTNIYNNNTGNVGIGTSAPAAELEVVSTATNMPHGILSTQYSNNQVADAHLWLRKARGTPGSPSPVQSGDELGAVKFRGYNSGNGFHTNDQTEIVAIATENFTSTANGSYLKFMTTPNGSANGVERLRIDETGNVNITGTSNELNRTSTGSANLIPIAYASISDNGTVNANTGNLTSANVWDSSNYRYKVKISGENYTSSGYITIVTLIGTNGKVEVDDDGNGYLIITVWSPSNFKIQSDLQFITYKP
ncbi:MAG: hypothetical protein WAQ28_08865 [Bacteroidia bacterium]